MYLIAFFFSTPSGHAQWAHTCPTLPQGSSEKMPTTSESPPLTLRASSASFVYRSFPERTGDRANGPVPSVFFSRGGGKKKGRLSFLFLLPFRCCHTITRREAQECERDGDGKDAVATLVFFSPCKTSCTSLMQIGGSQRCRPCLMMRAVNAVHGIVRRK